MDERRGMDQLDRDRGRQQLFALGRRNAGGEEHQQRPKPLAAGGDRRAGIGSELVAVPGRELVHAQLKPVHQPRDRLAARRPDRVDGHCRAHVRTSPTWIAMMPPAVKRYSIESSPTSDITAASASGPGKRRTELGRYE